MLVRQHVSKQFGNAKLWVSEAVAREDKMFDKPLWRGERTPDDEYDERLRRIKILRKYYDTHSQAAIVLIGWKIASKEPVAAQARVLNARICCNAGSFGGRSVL